MKRPFDYEKAKRQARIQRTFATLCLMCALMCALLVLFPPEKPKRHTLELVMGTDLFWDVYDAEYSQECCPDEATAAVLLRMKGYEINE